MKYTGNVISEKYSFSHQYVNGIPSHTSVLTVFLLTPVC